LPLQSIDSLFQFRQAMRTLHPLACSNFGAAKADRWFSATPKTRLYLRPRFFSFPFHARAMNSGLILHVIHCQLIWPRMLQIEIQTERETVTTDLAVSRSRPIVQAVGKYLHYLEFNLTEGPQDNGTVLLKTKTRTETPLSTCERAEESSRGVSSSLSIIFYCLDTMSLTASQPVSSSSKPRD
jgi:hypothetical protein